MRAVCFGPVVALLASLGVTLGACAQPTTADSAEQAEPGETHAFLRVERTVAAGPDGQKLEGRAAASFLRTVQPGAERPLVAARLVGALLDVPRESGCVPRLASQPSVALRTLSPVDLVPAGDISVQSGDVTTLLAARAYPDVAHLVSGIVYTSPDVAEEVLPSDGLVRFRASGSASVAPLDAALDAPESLVFGLVGAQRVEGPVVTARRGAVEFSWEASKMPADDGEPSIRDEEYLDVTTSTGTRYRCVPSEPGKVELPAEAVGDATDLNVLLHRVRTRGFRSDGLSSGTLQVDAATALVVQVEDGG